MTQPTALTAALAGIPSGLQAQGVWSGRRQLFVRFAGEAETATMYTADALAAELHRGLSRSAFHSISIGGRDPLANVEYIRAALDRAEPSVPVMLDCDGQRPAEMAPLLGALALVQVTIDGAGTSPEPFEERALDTLRTAATAGVAHGLVIVATERTTDAHILRIVERAHATTERVAIVVHPGTGVPVDRDRRWTSLFERAAALHHDVRVALRLPPPTGMR